MPKFKIGYGVSWIANSTKTDIIEADTLGEAEEIVKDTALEQLEYWADPIDEVRHD